jgi:hypothetical protein
MTWKDAAWFPVIGSVRGQWTHVAPLSTPQTRPPPRNCICIQNALFAARGVHSHPGSHPTHTSAVLFAVAARRLHEGSPRIA